MSSILSFFAFRQVGVNILGTRPEDIDRAEDRDKFSAMLDSIGVDQVGRDASAMPFLTFVTGRGGRQRQQK